MKGETPEQKYDRLRQQIQNLVLTAYPNPERRECPGTEGVREVARRAAADYRDNMEDNPHYTHILHCSPCYAEFLSLRRELARPADPSFKMPKRAARNLGKTLDQLEKVMKRVVGGEDK